MPDEQVVGDLPDAVSDATGPENQAEQNKEKEEKHTRNEPITIKYEDHQRAIKDALKNKERANEAESKLASFEEQRLKDNEDWKTLSERATAKADEYKTKFEDSRTAFIENEKYTSIKAALLKAGLRGEAEQDIDLLDLKGVQYELTSNGRVLLHGVESYVDEVKKNRPHWFASNGIPKFNPGGAGGSSVSDELLTPQKVVELERKYLREGNKQKVAELYERYQAQRRQK